MNQHWSDTRFKGVYIIILGITIAIFGVALDAYLWAQHYASMVGPGPRAILIGTVGLFFFFPLGIILLIFGICVVVYSYKQWPRVQELLDR